MAHSKDWQNFPEKAQTFKLVVKNIKSAVLNMLNEQRQRTKGNRENTEWTKKSINREIGITKRNQTEILPLKSVKFKIH